MPPSPENEKLAGLERMCFDKIIKFSIIHWDKIRVQNLEL